MSFVKSKKNINEEKIKIRKTISLIGRTIATDWKILIGTFFGILLIGLIFTWNTYKTISEQSFLNEEEQNPRNSLRVNTEQLDRVINNLNSKKEVFDSLNNQ